MDWQQAKMLRISMKDGVKTTDQQPLMIVNHDGGNQR